MTNEHSRTCSVKVARVGGSEDLDALRDDLYTIADQLDRAFPKLNADQMDQTASDAIKSSRAALPNSAGTVRRLGHTASEPPIGIEPMTYALRVASTASVALRARSRPVH